MGLGKQASEGRSKMKHSRLTCLAAIISILIVLTGCRPTKPVFDTVPSPTIAPSTALPASTSSPTEPPAPPTPAETKPSPPEHRIGVRLSAGVGEFYDRFTGEKFIPRGYNYIRVAPMSPANPSLWHATLNPGLYDPERAEAALREMHSAGYNVVRIFIDCCREGNNAGAPGGGISKPYLQNVIDFMNKARANDILILMVMDLTPAQGGYDDMWAHCCDQFDGDNLRYLTVGGHSAERRFNRDFIRALIANGAPMETIFAYDLTNEVSFSANKPPLNLTAGRVSTANGKRYDLSDPADKQRMMDENLVYWINQQRASILQVDPSALVGVSFPAINLGNTVVNPGIAIAESEADFIDLHVYLGWGLSFEKYMKNFHYEGNSQKPVVMGEFGAATRAYPKIEVAIEELIHLQAESCQYGFDGWLMWTYDEDSGADLWNGMSSDGQIHQALAPANRPDPCADVTGS